MKLSQLRRESMNKFMNQAKQNADNGINQKEGGPFGAVITDKDGNEV